MNTEIQSKGTGEHIVFFPVIYNGKNKVYSCDKDDYISLVLGQKAWNIDPNGYLQRKNSNNETESFHRLVLKAAKNQWVDHINWDVTNNEKSNLRFCTPSQNNYNYKVKGGTSKYKGVVRVVNWKAQITNKGKVISLGTFLKEEDAARAYDKKARELHGKYGTYNFPLEGERSAI